MAFNLTTPILGTDCIGDSRSTINNNFSALDVAISDNRFTIQASDTIDLSYVRTASNYITLSADVVNNSIGLSKITVWSTVSASPTLSAEAMTSRVAAAWITFDGRTGTPGVSSAFNTLTAIKQGTGNYKIIFTQPLLDITYPVITTSKTKGIYLYTGDYTTTSFNVSSETFAGVATDAFVSAVVYSY